MIFMIISAPLGDIKSPKSLTASLYNSIANFQFSSNLNIKFHWLGHSVDSRATSILLLSRLGITHRVKEDNLYVLVCILFTCLVPCLSPGIIYCEKAADCSRLFKSPRPRYVNNMSGDHNLSNCRLLVIKCRLCLISIGEMSNNK
jgi:hypothetical protein